MQAIITHTAVALAAGLYGIVAGGVTLHTARGEIDPALSRQQRLHAGWVKRRALVWPYALIAVQTARAPYHEKGE